MITIAGEQENIEDDDKVSTLEFFRPTLRFLFNFLRSEIRFINAKKSKFWAQT